MVLKKIIITKTEYILKKRTYICNMESLKINLLNPKASKLLKNLEDLRLISIEKYPNKSLKQFLNKLRSKPTISLEDISKEVDYVREKRYDFKKS